MNTNTIKAKSEVAELIEQAAKECENAMRNVFNAIMDDDSTGAMMSFMDVTEYPYTHYLGTDDMVTENWNIRQCFRHAYEKQVAYELSSIRANISKMVRKS